METDDEWEKIKKSSRKLESNSIDFASLKEKPKPSVKTHKATSLLKEPNLADQFFNFIKKNSFKSLVEKHRHPLFKSILKRT